MSSILEQVRTAIEESGQSCYSIWKSTGIPEPQLSRLMARKGGLSIQSLERLLEHLGLEMKLQKRRGK